MSSDHRVAGQTDWASHSIKDDHVEDAAELSPGAIVIDEETNRKLLRKIDKRLMPVVRCYLKC